MVDQGGDPRVGLVTPKGKDGRPGWGSQSRLGYSISRLMVIDAV